MTGAELPLHALSRILESSPGSVARALAEREVIADAELSALTLAELVCDRGHVLAQLQGLSARELEIVDHPDRLQPENSGMVDDLIERFILISLDDGEVTRSPEVETLWPEIRILLNTPSSPRQSLIPNTEAAIDVARAIHTLDEVERVVRQMTLDDPSDEANYRDLALRLGLIVPLGPNLRTSRVGARWLQEGLLTRWAHLVTTLWWSLPGWYRDRLSASNVSNDAPAQDGEIVSYPLISDKELASWQWRSDAVGLSIQGAPSTLVRAVTTGALEDELAEVLPTPLDILYPDGPDTLTAAGPLTPETESVLRQIATWSSGGLAPRFQLTKSSLIAARQSGLTAEEITDFIQRHLGDLAEGGVGYQVRDTLRACDSLTLTSEQSGSHLQATESLTLDLILADRRLATLQLTRIGELIARSPLSVSQVHSRLIDEGYAHLVTDPDGRLWPEDRGQGMDVPGIGGNWNVDRVTTIRNSWRQQRESDPAGWWAPLLEAVISRRGHAVIEVEVSGESMSLEIKPLSLANNRLRALDLRSDVERTIPLPLIRRLDPGPRPSTDP